MITDPRLMVIECVVVEKMESWHVNWKQVCSLISQNNVFEVVLRKSVPTKIRHIILYISDSKGQVDEFVGGLTVATRT